MSESISFTFEGREVTGRRGESLAAALIAAGLRGFRTTRTGAERGIFCGMGVCQDCLVEVDGQSNRRACMVKLDRPMTIRREGFARELPMPARGVPPRTADDIPEETPEILVVGAGPGGLSAAIAARRAGAEVVILDERPLPGGQYFKQISVDAAAAPPDAQHEEGRRLIEQARALGVEIRSGVEIWGAFPPATLAASQDGIVRSFAPKRLIVAAGAYERGVPFPGWTLPGVMTTGAAQTLWRSYRRLAGKRILIAGNGPLNFQVATELSAGGAEIAAVVELAEMPAVGSMLAFVEMAIASPRLVREGLGYRRALRAGRVPVLYGSAVTRVEATEGGLRVHVSARSALVHSFAVDTVCLGYGFHPSNEILRALGCAHDYDGPRDQLVTRVAAEGKTTVPTVFALGDCTGLGGARMALAQGTLVGCAVAAELGHAIQGDLAAERGRAQLSLARHQMFQASLWRLFTAPRLGVDLATPETIVCRCEEISAAQIDAALSDGCPSIGELKRTTRAGMGACQGRYCGPLLSNLMARRLGRAPEEDVRFAPRVPLKPVAVAEIARPASK
jgi:NADPH-dependent 2,4-dienoyl-CoA reductase/sulfur reductase-like enzyme